MILATFLVALYSFNLTYRSDMRTVEVEPVARALISKLIIKQQAAGRYIRGNTPPYATISNPDGTVVSSDTLTYTSGIISTEDLQQSEGVSYLPYGFKDDGSVTAEIYCVDKNDLSLAKDCSSEDAIRYLVAYMTVPQRWLNIQTGLPNNDLKYKAAAIPSLLRTSSLRISLAKNFNLSTFLLSGKKYLRTIA